MQNINIKYISGHITYSFGLVIITEHNIYIKHYTDNLPPTTKLGQGNIFTGICDSVHRGEGGLPQCMLGYHHPPGLGTPLGPGTPPGTRYPPRIRQAPSQSRAYWEIRSTSGRYASYWNTILFSIVTILVPGSVPCSVHEP